MKTKQIIALLFALLVLESSAQSGDGGFYQALQYRMNDPFVFCTQGQDRQRNKSPCWIPLPPYTGNYMMMPYCRPPNPYGKNWTWDDTNSLRQYLAVCPAAMQSGAWERREGSRPEYTPHRH